MMTFDAPICMEYCPIEACMFWLDDEDNPLLGQIATDKTLCIGWTACNNRGPNGISLDGCPWDAIKMVPTEKWKAQQGVTLPETPGPVSERLSVWSRYV